MYIVIFEIKMKHGNFESYISQAQKLLPVLDKITGLISVERFRNVNDEGKFLSLSFWQDLDSIALWRNNTAHRLAQLAGRKAIFSDYKISVAVVQRQYTLNERINAPEDSNLYFSANAPTHF